MDLFWQSKIVCNLDGHTSTDMMGSAFQHHELQHLLDRKQRTAVRPGGGSMNRAYCSSAFFFSSRSYNMYSDHEKIILTALSVTFLHFFHSAPYGGAHQCDITDYSVENPLLFHIIAEIMDSGLLSVLRYTVVISHLNDEWRYSRHI